MRQRIPILIVDDDTDFLELIEYNLKLSGFKVTTTTSGLEALEIARTQPRRHRPTWVIGVINRNQVPAVAVGSDLATVSCGRGAPAEIQQLAPGDFGHDL